MKWNKTILTKWGGGYTQIQENRGLFIIEQVTVMGRNNTEKHSIVLGRKEMEKISKIVNNRNLVK